MKHSMKSRAVALVVRSSVVGVMLLALGSLAPIREASGPSVGQQVTPLPTLVAVGDATEVDPGVGAEMVGLTWFDDQRASFEVRAFADGAWTEWLHLADEGGASAAPASSVPAERLSAGPAWVGHDARQVQVRVESGAPRGVELHAIDTEPPAESGSALGPPEADAAVGPPFITSRGGWGADESWRSANPGCSQPQYGENVYMATVHHTVNANSYGPGDSASLVRGIYSFHVFTNGWCDIGYNFLVDRYGQIFEGRYGGPHLSVVGAHAGGFNSVSTGVAVIGDFQTGGVPAAAYASLLNLLVWKLSYHGVDPYGTVTTVVQSSTCNCQHWPVGTTVALPTIVGHRDLNSTACPGQYLYPLLDQLRADVAAALADPNTHDQDLVCDWNGDGIDTPVVYQYGRFYVRDSNSSGRPDVDIHYGAQGYTAVCGDWDGDGVDGVGVYYDGWWYLRNSGSPGPPDIVFRYGTAGYAPVVGNWNGQIGSGKGDGIGVYINGNWYLRNTPTAGAPEIAFAYGAPYYKPFVGRWTGAGYDGIGVYVHGSWFLRATAEPGPPQGSQTSYGLPGDTPIAGDWDGNGRDDTGVTRGSWWYQQSTALGGATRVFQYSSYAYPF